MSTLLAVLRVDLRLLRKEFLGAVALLGLAFLGAASVESRVLGDGTQTFLLGAFMVALGLSASMRLRRADRALASMSRGTPVAGGTVVLAQALTRYALAFMVGLAFTLAIAPHTAAPWQRAGYIALWLLLLYQWTSWSLDDKRPLSPIAEYALIMVILSSLVGTLPLIADATGDLTAPFAGPASLGFGPRYLFLLLAFVLILRIANTGETLPHAGPKNVVPQVRAPEGAPQRGLRAWSRARIARRLGLGGPQVWLGLPLWWVLGMYFAIHGAFSDESLAFSPAPVLLAGFMLLATLRETTERVAFMRVLPVSTAGVWRWALLPRIAGLLLGIATTATVQLVLSPGPPLFDTETGTTRYTNTLNREHTVFGTLDYERFVLPVPAWTRGWFDEATLGIGLPVVRERRWWLRGEEDWRPDYVRLEPGPENRLPFATWKNRDEPRRPGSAWAEHVPLRQEREHFLLLLEMYLRRVHGVHAERADLEDAFIPADSFTSRVAWVRLQLFGELWSAHGSIAFQDEDRTVSPHLRRLELDDALTEGHLDTEENLHPPLELYALGPSLERLEQYYGGAVHDAARVRWLLDLGVKLLALALFLRMVLLRRSMVGMVPLAAPIALYGWFGSRGEDWHLAVRDATLAWPWVALGVGVALIGLVVLSIGRNLERIEP